MVTKDRVLAIPNSREKSFPNAALAPDDSVSARVAAQRSAVNRARLHECGIAAP